MMSKQIRTGDAADPHATGPDFRNADLRGANFTGAKLDGSCFRRASLTDAILDNADLRNASLRDAILDNVGLTDADVGAKPILITGLRYWVFISPTWMRIGCERHPHEAWETFSDEAIAGMHDFASDFWAMWREPLLAMCHNARMQYQLTEKE